MDTRYQLEFSPLANQQLHSILLSIRNYLTLEKALEQYQKLLEKIQLLQTNPYLGVKPKYQLLYDKGYRLFIVKRLVIAYYVDENTKTIKIRAIFDQKQDYVTVMMNTTI